MTNNKKTELSDRIRDVIWRQHMLTLDKAIDGRKRVDISTGIVSKDPYIIRSKIHEDSNYYTNDRYATVETTYKNNEIRSVITY